MAIRLIRRIWAQAGPGGGAADAGLRAPHDFAPAGRSRDPSGSAIVQPDATVCYGKHCVLGFNSQQSQEEEADISKAFSQRLPNAGSLLTLLLRVRKRSRNNARTYRDRLL